MGSFGGDPGEPGFHQTVPPCRLGGWDAPRAAQFRVDAKKRDGLLPIIGVLDVDLAGTRASRADDRVLEKGESDGVEMIAIRHNQAELRRTRGRTPNPTSSCQSPPAASEPVTSKGEVAPLRLIRESEAKRLGSRLETGGQQSHRGRRPRESKGGSAPAVRRKRTNSTLESSNTGGESRTGAGGLLLYINELGGDLAHGLACSGGHRSSGSAKYHGRVSPNAVSRQLARFRQHSITALREYTLRRRLGPCRSSMGKSQAGWVARWRE